MSLSESDTEYFLTSRHFAVVDPNKKMSDSESESDNNSNSDNSDSNSDSNSDYYSNSDSESENLSSNSDNDSDNDSDNESETESESESTKMLIDPDDLFNTKTNGNEFYGEVLKNRYLILKKLG